MILQNDVYEEILRQSDAAVICTISNNVLSCRMNGSGEQLMAIAADIVVNIANAIRMDDIPPREKVLIALDIVKEMAIYNAEQSSGKQALDLGKYRQRFM